MKEKMISFNGEMGQVIYDLCKTQTRRPLNLQPRYTPNHRSISEPDLANNLDWTWWDGNHTQGIYHMAKSPFPKVGEVFLVREPATVVDAFTLVANDADCYQVRYDDGSLSSAIVIPDRIKPIPIGHKCPNGCFREAARTRCKVLRVWVERVQEISEMDARAEGVKFLCDCGGEVDIHDPESHWACASDDGMTASYKNGFSEIWDSIYGTWARNDWVWCCEFEVIK